MIATLSSTFTLSLTSPDDLRVVDTIYDVAVELTGRIDSLGQLATRTAAVNLATIDQIWEEYVLLRVPNARALQGRASHHEAVPPFPDDNHAFSLALWVAETLANHEWLEGPPFDFLSGNLARGFSTDSIRTTLLTSITVTRDAGVQMSRRSKSLSDATRIAVDALATAGIRKPWISYQ
jgi:hypothetical protein